jgi:hypothetical protein
MTEEELSSVGNALLYEPIGQLRHQKALCDFVSHSKASLDALTVFIVERLDLQLSGGDRDLRKQHCRNVVSGADTVIGLELGTLNHWLDPNASDVQSLVAVRDDWLHRSSPDVSMIQPRPAKGLFPIPRKLQGLDRNQPFDPSAHMRTSEFTGFHLLKLVRLTNCVIRRMVTIEKSSLATPPKRRSQPVLTLLPLWVTNPTVYKGDPVVGDMTKEFVGS